MGGEAAGLKVQVLDWLREEGVLEPALYQRPYSWDESLVTPFVEAICSEESRDIGLIIVESTGSDGAKFIADGQQRLVTFALMLKACGLGADDRGDAPLRMTSLLRAAGKNVESLYRQAQAERVVARLMKNLSKADAQRRLGEVTMALLENAGPLDADAVRMLFEDANIAGVQLSGGEILKARHYGVIIKAHGCEDEAKACEKWLRGKDGPEVGLQKLDLWRLGDPKTPDGGAPGTGASRMRPYEALSVNDFMDARDSAFGPGFAQQLLGRLMEERGWWLPLAEKTAEHLDPFEFYEGLPADMPEPALWSASAPGDFEAGLGYFRMLQRIGMLYADYVKNILVPEGAESLDEALGKLGAGESDGMLALSFEADGDGRENDSPVPGSPGPGLTPGRLVVLAAGIAACALREICFRDDQIRFDKATLEMKLQGASKPHVYAKAIVGFFDAHDDCASIAKLLGFYANAKGGLSLTTPGYGLPVGLFAAALAWHDAFLRPPPKDQAKRAEMIVRLLVLLIFNTLRRTRFETAEAQLQLPVVLKSARSSRTIESAWWAFKRGAELDRGFLVPFARLLWELEQEPNSKLGGACLAWCAEILDELFPQDL